VRFEFPTIDTGFALLFLRSCFSRLNSRLPFLRLKYLWDRSFKKMVLRFENSIFEINDFYAFSSILYSLPFFILFMLGHSTFQLTYNRFCIFVIIYYLNQSTWFKATSGKLFLHIKSVFPNLFFVCGNLSWHLRYLAAPLGNLIGMKIKEM
jgi:hypothetical protein